MARDENEEASENESYGKDGFYSYYETKEILGKGMSSTVRRCIEKTTGLEYAVKILDITTERNSEDQAKELRESTLSEIRLLRMVSGHRNIITLHDFYESSTFLFIVFELAKGGELFDFLTRHVTLSEKKIRNIMKQVFEAVKEMHSRKIVHRDLKPENILLVEDDVVKVTDFGFAYELKDGEKLKELVGTPGYLAPEVLKVNMFDKSEGYAMEVDLWACGVIMYTLFCGYAPFYHRKQLYMLRSIAEGKYEFRSPEWDEVSEVSKDLIRKLLCVAPTDRITAVKALSHPFFQQPANAEEFLEAAQKYDARKKFRLCIIRVRLLVRLQKLKYMPVLVPAGQVRVNPYGTRKIRKQIDNLAFHVYGHWVKKGREQYRDALFANSVRAESQDEPVT